MSQHIAPLTEYQWGAVDPDDGKVIPMSDEDDARDWGRRFRTSVYRREYGPWTNADETGGTP